VKVFSPDIFVPARLIPGPIAEAAHSNAPEPPPPIPANPARTVVKVNRILTLVKS
jgi:hypothetical protein